MLLQLTSSTTPVHPVVGFQYIYLDRYISIKQFWVSLMYFMTLLYMWDKLLKVTDRILSFQYKYTFG